MKITIARRKGLQRFWLHHGDHYHAVTQTYNNWAETRLGDRDTSAFVTPSAAIARSLSLTFVASTTLLTAQPWWLSFAVPKPTLEAHNPTVISSVALTKGPQRFFLHCSDRCCALMLTSWNSPLWQRCERYNNVLSSSWPPWLAWSIERRGHHVTSMLIGTSRKLPAYNYMSSLALWTMLEYELVDAESANVSKGQSRTCYQECSCHL